MKLVLTGTVQRDFARMIEATLFAFSGAGQKIIVQYGYTDVSMVNFPSHFKTYQFLSPVELKNAMKMASAIVISGGEATALEVIQHSLVKPILFPRFKKFGEHVDDQQVEIASYFASNGIGYCAMNKEELLKYSKLVKPLPAGQRRIDQTKTLPVIVENLHELMRV